jgi:hypothetical protein
LEKLPAGKFDYGIWVDTKTWKGMTDLSCGTTACALGWATAIPEFQKLGLYMNFDGIPKLIGRGQNAEGWRAGYEAGAVVFGLAEEEADYIFYPEGNEVEMTAQQVAQRIKTFLLEDRNIPDDREEKANEDYEGEEY